jgi:tRNA pseudouridine55 synthase
LARRETYRSRNRDILQDDDSFGNDSSERFEIDPEVQQQFADGKLLLIDKPLHWTSFDIIRKFRGLLGIRKIGHAGTLDPLATGLLIVCTGKFTKKINEYMAQEKEYTGHFTLGAVTPTYDLESGPQQVKDYSFVTDEMLQNAAKKFIGEIEQLPPIYSAIKKDGVRLYESARKGEEIELNPRKVTINDFSITKVELPVVEFKVVCTTGTYIRSLANDFGQELGCGAYLSSLRRTRIGAFVVSESLTIKAFEESLIK